MGLGFPVFLAIKTGFNRTGPVWFEPVSGPVRLIFIKNTEIQFGWFFESKPNRTKPWTPLMLIICSGIKLVFDLVRYKSISLIKKIGTLRTKIDNRKNYSPFFSFLTRHRAFSKNIWSLKFLNFSSLILFFKVFTFWSKTWFCSCLIPWVWERRERCWKIKEERESKWLFTLLWQKTCFWY